MTETFNIKFHEKQLYNLVFPPTVYEFLWRYEYISYKHTITDINDSKKKIMKPNEDDMDFEEAVASSDHNEN